jgi:hypothetical protein
MCGQGRWSRRGGSTIASVSVAIVLFLSLRTEVEEQKGSSATVYMTVVAHLLGSRTL